MTLEIPSNGHYYGYPKCCILDFHKMLRENKTFKDIPVERQRTAKNGFIPCQSCAEKIGCGKIKVDDCILHTRQCPKPFSKSVLR